MLPESSESTRACRRTRRSPSARRGPIMPSSMTPAISCPKRTQRVQWMQRVISSAETSGPRFLWNTTRFGLGVARGRRAVADREVLQLALAALVADRAVERMVDQQELHHALLRLDRLLGVRPHLHALGRRRRARRQRLRRLLDLHQAHPAVGGDRQLLVIAEVRHVDAELVRGVHHRAAVRALPPACRRFRGSASRLHQT